MSENIEKMNENEKLMNNLNDLKLTNNESINETFNDLNINSINEENSDYESCEESLDNNNKDIDENEIQTDDEFANQLEMNLTEEELNERKLEAIKLKTEGNKQFKEGFYEKSIELYTCGIRLCPTVFTSERAVMYANRSAAKIHLNLNDNAIKDCNKAIQLNPNYIKALLRRAQLYRNTKEKLDESLSDYKKVLELDPNCSEAIIASNQLPQEINDRNEKMKTEMMDKLKDLGNLVLKPFGLSTDNFKLTQNSETGGYSVNFQNN